MKALLLACLFALPATGARAALTQADLAEVSLSPPPGARLPPGLALRDADGRPLSAAEAQAGRPALLVFADYTCTVLCGTELGLAAGALRETGLRPGVDYSFLVLGIDPKDGPAEAAALQSAYLPPGSPAHFLTADAATIQRAEAAMGYAARYDAETDSYAHPLALLVLAGDGRLSRVLPPLQADAPALREALVEAGQGRIGSLGERLRLFCYGFDAAHGRWNALAERMLDIGTGLTVLALGGFLLWALRRGRQA